MYTYVWFTSKCIWFTLNFFGTLLTFLGIYNILKTLQQLKIYNPRIETNKFTLILHCVVLILNMIAVSFFSVPFCLFHPKQWVIIYATLTGTDTIVQLCICYICWTMGSSPKLRTHKATIFLDSNG